MRPRHGEILITHDLRTAARDPKYSGRDIRITFVRLSRARQLDGRAQRALIGFRRGPAALNPQVFVAWTGSVPADLTVGAVSVYTRTITGETWHIARHRGSFRLSPPARLVTPSGEVALPRDNKPTCYIGIARGTNTADDEAEAFFNWLAQTPVTLRG